LTTDVLALLKEVYFRGQALPDLFYLKRNSFMSIETQQTYTKETLFKPTSSVKETIAERIDRTARSIQKVETDARIAKTLRLRKARMEYEETIVPPVAKKKRARKQH
jgi:hypothetical protein